MITFDTENIRPMPLIAMSNQILSTAVEFPTVINKGDFCWCRYLCPAMQTVFGGNEDPDGGTDLKVDQTSFLFKVILEGDTVEMKLYKDGEEVADLDDDTYGTFYDFGDLANPLLSGYLLNWKSVLDAFDGGQYRVVTTVTLLGQVFEYESMLFNLMAYNEEAADGTVRIETWQNGYNESDPIDFSGINWYAQYRMHGDFGNRQPSFETDNYLDSGRTIRQIQDGIKDTYTLEIPEIYMEEKDNLIYRELLANRIRITDYNIPNEDRYRPVEVYPAEIDKLTYRVNIPGSSAQIKFRPKTENQLKRNIYFP